MTKTEKAEIVNSLTEAFKSAEAVLICDYKGLNVQEFEDLRNQVRALGGSMRVAKNTLASISLKNAKKEGLTLKDTNVFIWGGETLSVIKTIAKFAENRETFAIKQGYIDDQRVDGEYINTLSKLPSREGLIGMLLSVWTAPLRGFVTGLDNLSKKLAA